MTDAVLAALAGSPRTQKHAPPPAPGPAPTTGTVQVPVPPLLPGRIAPAVAARWRLERWVWGESQRLAEVMRWRGGGTAGGHVTGGGGGGGMPPTECVIA